MGERMATPQDSTTVDQLARMKFRIHWLCWAPVALIVVSFAYLLLAGESAQYGFGHNDPEITQVVFPAWDHGWPFRFMVRGPNFDFDGASHRWPFGRDQELVLFSWKKLLLDLAVIAAITAGSAWAVNHFLLTSAFQFRLSHLFVLIAWIATGIGMFVHAEQRRSPMYDNTQYAQPLPESVKRFLYFDDTLVDVIPTAVCFVALGLFWWSVLHGVGRLCDYAVARRQR